MKEGWLAVLVVSGFMVFLTLLAILASPSLVLGNSVEKKLESAGFNTTKNYTLFEGEECFWNDDCGVGRECFKGKCYDSVADYMTYVDENQRFCCVDDDLFCRKTFEAQGFFVLPQNICETTTCEGCTKGVNECLESATSRVLDNGTQIIIDISRCVECSTFSDCQPGYECVAEFCEKI